MKKVISILYIDDEADSEKFESKFALMREEGIEVTIAINVDEVLPLLRKLYRELDLIILDIIMPYENYYTKEETNGGSCTGLSILKDIRKEFKDIPIIIVSIHRRKNAKGILEEYRIIKYLEKPINTSHLIAAIKDIVKKTK